MRAQQGFQFALLLAHGGGVAAHGLQVGHKLGGAAVALFRVLGEDLAEDAGQAGIEIAVLHR